MNCIHEKKNDNYDVHDIEDNRDDALVDIKSDGLYGGLLLIPSCWTNLQPLEGEYNGTRVTAGNRQCHDSFKK